MKLNYEKLYKLINLTKSLIDCTGKKELTNDEIDANIDLAKTSIGFSLEFEEQEYIKKELSYAYQIQVDPGQCITDNYDEDSNWYDEIKDDIEPIFWERYKNYLINDKHFSPTIVSSLNKVTLDKYLMNYIGNPNAQEFFKRGLAIGDVQSGKTSTYIGLMCKAIDAGYKIVILLTGVLESLRQQTQIRVEEGLIGYDSSNTSRRVGVGLKDKRPPMINTFTSRDSDFIGNSDQTIYGLAGNNPVVFVIKKNSTVLNKLITWLKKYNLDGQNKINLPLLLIDDEADNASINTKEKEDPTKINKLIRNLLDIFTKSSYVGFTATPYANIFIDPETTEEMENDDLFPENFIMTLPTPSNYFGPLNLFAKSDSDSYKRINYIKDCGNEEKDGKTFYHKHKQNWDKDLPESLIDSIYAFYLVNAIRDIRKDKKSHRSMLINMSRFKKVQNNIKLKVDNVIIELSNAMRHFIKSDYEKRSNPIIERLYRVFEEQYFDCGIPWKDVALNLVESTEDIELKVVNSDKSAEKLSYSTTDSTRVIVIGGLALSRGLTIEGLIITYFYRNTSTYDVLMQMGRWFGYRDKYKDLFRIWISQSSAEWYAEIAEATDILKQDMYLMCERQLKPKYFGIRVRNDNDSLKITAPNKMRNSSYEYDYETISGQMFETPYLNSDISVSKDNFNTVDKFISDLLNSSYKFTKDKSNGEHYAFFDIDKDNIIDLLKKLKISNYSNFFKTKEFIDYIYKIKDTSLDKWDIVFVEGDKKDKVPFNFHGMDIYKVQRNNCEIDIRKDEEVLKIGQRGKLGSPTDGKSCVNDFNGKLGKDIIEEAKNNYKKDYDNNHINKFDDKKKNYPSNTWFKYIKDRKPLLLIYFLNIDSNNNSDLIKNYNANMGNIPTVAFAIGFPQNDDMKNELSRFRVNSTYNYYDNTIEDEDE